jgi:hypothetical protein
LRLEVFSAEQNVWQLQNAGSLSQECIDDWVWQNTCITRMQVSTGDLDFTGAPIIGAGAGGDRLFQA